MQQVASATGGAFGDWEPLQLFLDRRHHLGTWKARGNFSHGGHQRGIPHRDFDFHEPPPARF